MKITLSQLKKAGACKKQRKKFERLFGKSVNVTVELCKAHAGLFDWDWAAEELLTWSAQKVYNVAYDEALTAFDKPGPVAFARAYNSKENQ